MNLCTECGYTSDYETECPHCGEPMEEAERCEICGEPVARREALGWKHTVCPVCAGDRSTEDMRQYLRETHLWEDFCLYWVAGFRAADKPPADIKALMLRFVADRLEAGDDRYEKSLWEYVQEDISDYVDWRMSHEATDAADLEAS